MTDLTEATTVHRDEAVKARPARGLGARAHLRRPADGGARQHHRQHRAALHPADLDIDPANLSWIVTGYALAFGGLLLLGGRLGDLYGRRRIFIIGVMLFAVASAVGGLAQNEPMLLGSRGFQGLGAALASPTALALITTTFPAGPLRNRAFAVFAAMSGVGAAIGLILGGWLTGIDPELGWRLTFLINVPIGLAAAYFAPKVLPDSDHHAGVLDVPGAIIGTVGLLSLVFGITRTSNPRLRRPAPTAGASRSAIASCISASRCSWPSSLVETPDQEPDPAAEHLRQPLPRGGLRRDDDHARRDVRDVLLPLALRPERHGLRLARGRLRVPPVLLRHGRRGHLRLQADDAGRPPLPRRDRHLARRRRRCSCSPASTPASVHDVLTAARAVTTSVTRSATGPTWRRTSS